MIKRIISQNHLTCFSSWLRTRTCSNYKMEETQNSQEDKSVRSTKRSRARAHYRKKHNVEEKHDVEENMSLTDYYMENGLRKVYPYYYNFATYAKQRWFGRSIIDVFTKEFPGETEEKYMEEIEAGRLTVNGKKVSINHKLSNGEFLQHKIHRHENPTVAAPIEIIADTPEVLVINKPASIPCHPCGRYRFNSITFILEKELGYKNLRTLYRLDRMTSGVLIMPKTKASSSKMEKQLYNRELQKEYVCRVVGRFPDGPVECNEPLGVLSNTLYMNRVDPRGKESSTTFNRISYNGTTSVVRCVPHTGRTHQIRVHLQYLGYPIVNDNLYNTPAFGPSRGKGGLIDRPVEQIVEEVRKYHNTGVWKLGINPLYERKMRERISDAVSTTGHETLCDHTDSKLPKTAVDKPVDSQLAHLSKADSNKLTDSQAVTNDSEVQISDIKSDRIDISMEEDETPAKKAKLIEEECSENAARDLLHPEIVPGLMSHDCSKIGTNETVITTTNSSISLQVAQVQKEWENPSIGTQSTDNTETQSQIYVNSVDQSKHVSDTSDRDSENQSDSVKSIDSAPVKIQEIHEPVRTLPPFDEERVEIDEACENCRTLCKDPDPADLVMYLHALKYKGPDWEYSTPLPDWAQDDWKESSTKHIGHGEPE